MCAMCLLHKIIIEKKTNLLYCFQCSLPLEGVGVRTTYDSPLPNCHFVYHEEASYIKALIIHIPQQVLSHSYMLVLLVIYFGVK